MKESMANVSLCMKNSAEFPGIVVRHIRVIGTTCATFFICRRNTGLS